MINKIEKLALGTAQFGLPYGVSNVQGKVSASEVDKILNSAKSLGINTIDSASAYGNSEAVLGTLLNNYDTFSIFTKLRSLPTNLTDIERWLSKEIKNSLNSLRRPNVEAILLHDPNQLLQPFGKELYRALNIMREKGLFNKIGISVYHPRDLELLLQKFTFDVVQLPFNIMDRRFLKNDLLYRLKNMGIIIHARSVFLQGLLLMSRSDRPKKFLIWKELWDHWHDYLEDTCQTALQSSLNYALSYQEIDRVIVGVESERQLLEIAHATYWNLNNTFEQFSTVDERLLVPSNWKNL